MLRRALIAIIVGIAAALVCLLVGVILTAIDVDAVKQIGNFLQKFSVVVGILVGFWNFLTGERPQL